MLMKFYTVRDELKSWDVNQIATEMSAAMLAADLQFPVWKGTTELRSIAGGEIGAHLHYDPLTPPKVVFNGDMNITTDIEVYTTLRDRLFAGSGKRVRYEAGNEIAEPALPDHRLSTLNPIFQGTVLEELHNYLVSQFNHPIRIRCQNRTVAGISKGLYWHKDYPVENRFHIPLWTNPGHVLLFSERDFEWRAGFDNQESLVPMDFVGHYVPPDGRVYEFETRNYMHAVASVGVGWRQPRWQQTRCHLSFWLAKN